MKKYFLLFIIFSFIFSNSLYSQVTVDPRDDFYEDAAGWYLKGLVDSLPQVKPYTLWQVREILAAVMASSNKEEAKRANDYWISRFHYPIHLKAEGDFGANFELLEDTDDDNNAKYEDDFQLYSAKASLQGEFSFNPYMGLGLDLSIRGTNNNESLSNQFPRFKSFSDYMGMEWLSFTEGDIDFSVNPGFNLTFGNSFLNASLGYTRLGYGLFTDSDLVLNPNSNPMPNAVISFVSDLFEYTHVQAIASAQALDSSDDYKWGKVYAFHSLRVPLLDRKFSISYYESVVYGEGFNPSYLMPVPWAIISNVAGFNENLIAGLNLQYKPVDCIAISTDFLFDDIDDLKSFVKLKWNDAAIKAAFKTGVLYTPTESICRMIKLDYTMVMPYTYSYYDTRDSTYNYSDYTNNGLSIGSDLIPNSHQFSVDIKFNPIKHFNILSTSKFILHANPQESLSASDIYSAYAYTRNGGLSQAEMAYILFNETTDFMNQEHKMAVVRSGLDFSYELVAKKFSSIKIFAGYSFEYIMNDGVDSSIYPGSYVGQAVDKEEIIKAYLSHQDMSPFMKIQNPAEWAKKEWVDNLKNTYHHYFKAGVILKL
ncbi:MAG: hypothetical protein K6F15_08600 [Treponema sp.]|nr:hypothetical protein [Treponema sp.]